MFPRSCSARLDSRCAAMVTGRAHGDRLQHAFILFLRQALLSRDRRSPRLPGCPCRAGAVRRDGAVRWRKGARFAPVAEHDGRLYLDLCDDRWRAVQIDPQGWRVVDRPPARILSLAWLATPTEPQPGGSLDELRPFLNIDEFAWTLIRGFLVAALRPDVPCPVLVVEGDQGAGKSTACRAISRLINPRSSALRGAPHDVRDLVAAARNPWLVCFDNLSHLPEELADAACRLATGGGFGGRELYSDHLEEAVFDATRPLVFNAIPNDASKVALVHLAARLRLGGYRLLDTQFLTPHLARLAASRSAAPGIAGCWPRRCFIARCSRPSCPAPPIRSPPCSRARSRRRSDARARTMPGFGQTSSR